VLAFSRSDRFTFGGAISGSGSVVKNCTGTTILTAANSYTGGTLVAAGTLQGDTRSLQGDVVTNAALVFDQAFDGTFRGALFGGGTVTKSGSGTVLLTGNHALTGPTTIQAGTLAFDGTLGGAVTVMQGGTFDATGIIGGSLVVDGTTSVRSPAAGGFGQLGVVGDATFKPGSVFGVAVEPDGKNATLVANGHATVDGATVAVTPEAGTYGRVTQYAIMRGLGGLSGTASATSTSISLEPYLTPDPTTLFLTLLRTDLPLQPFAVTGNGWGIGGALDRLKPGAAGDLKVVTRELTALDDRTLGRSLDAIAGEIHASATQLAAVDGDGIAEMIRAEISTRIGTRGLEQGGGASASGLWGGSRRRGWFRLRDERAHFDAAGVASDQSNLPGVHGGDGSLDGFALAADWSTAGGWLVGAGGSYGKGRLALDGLNERVTYAAPRGIGYVGYSWPWLAVDGGISVARTAYDITRSFAFTALAPTGRPLFDGVNREATSEPAGLAAEFWGEMRFDRRLGWWELQPTIGIRRARYGLDAWSEEGADALSLSAPAQTIASMQADIGVRFSRAAGRVRPYVGGSARRELTSGRVISNVELGGRSDGLFTVDGLAFAPDVAIGEAGLLFQTDRLGFSLSYVGRRGRQQTRHTVQLSVAFE
jgi:fibronectin-binding autotransporter adhesin